MRTRAIPERFCCGDSLRRGAISSVCTFTFTLPWTYISTFQSIASYWPKTANFPIPCIQRLGNKFCNSGWADETRMTRRPEGEKSLTISSAVSIQFTSVTDRRTDRKRPTMREMQSSGHQQSPGLWQVQVDGSASCSVICRLVQLPPLLLLSPPRRRQTDLCAATRASHSRRFIRAANAPVAAPVGASSVRRFSAIRCRLSGGLATSNTRKYRQTSYIKQLIN